MIRRRSSLRFVFAAPLAVALAATACPAAAQVPRFKPRGRPPAATASAPAPGAPDPTAADAYKHHMENGVKLFEDKNLEAALVEFKAAYEHRPRASPLLNIALCYKALFNYPKAIAALETALREHADTMDANDTKAAESAIAEMRALLGTVIAEVSPVGATLVIDGEDQPPGTAGKPIALGPGPHRFGARADGYAPAEQSLAVASGDKDKVVRLALVPDRGYVRVDALDPNGTIVLDQRPVGTGRWAGLVIPGTHVLEIDRPGQPPYAVQVIVAAGKAQDVRPGSGGIPLAGARPAAPLEPVVPPPPAPPKKEPPAPPMKGPYALVTAGLFFPTSHPQAFREAKINSGGAGGLRLGYRINTPAAFELMGEYANAFVPSAIDDSTYTLTSWRVGANLRLMTPGKSVRLVGGLGGGIVADSVKFSLSQRVSDVVIDHKVPDHDGIQAMWGDCARKCQAASGVDPYVLGELGLELDWSGVLAGLTVSGHFQSARGIVTAADEDVYKGSDPLIHVGVRLHVGYALW